MSTKLFVTDLDGTLLPTGQQVPPENIGAVQEAVSQGVAVTIATGRMYQAALPVARTLGVDLPIITYNGALIRSVGGEILYSSFLEPHLVRAVLEYCRAKKWYVQVNSEDELYYAEANEFSAAYEEDQQIRGHAVGWDGLLKCTRQVTKLLSISHDGNETDRRVAEMQEHFGKELYVSRSNAELAEVVNLGVSKAAAIEILAKKMGIGMEEVMAIGDSENDLAMLRAVGKSIAMGNAVPAVKNACDYETGICEENGFAQAVYRYVLA